MRMITQTISPRVGGSNSEAGSHSEFEPSEVAALAPMRFERSGVSGTKKKARSRNPLSENFLTVRLPEVSSHLDTVEYQKPCALAYRVGPALMSRFKAAPHASKSILSA